jgi:hypothetical protein
MHALYPPRSTGLRAPRIILETNIGESKNCIDLKQGNDAFKKHFGGAGMHRRSVSAIQTFEANRKIASVRCNPFLQNTARHHAPIVMEVTEIDTHEGAREARNASQP